MSGGEPTCAAALAQAQTLLVMLSKFKETWDLPRVVAEWVEMVLERDEGVDWDSFVVMMEISNAAMGARGGRYHDFAETLSQRVPPEELVALAASLLRVVAAGGAVEMVL